MKKTQKKNGKLLNELKDGIAHTCEPMSPTRSQSMGGNFASQDEFNSKIQAELMRCMNASKNLPDPIEVYRS